MLLIVVDNKRGCLPKFILRNPWVFDKCENMIFDLYQAESVEVILSASPASSKSLVSYTIQEAPRYLRNTEPYRNHRQNHHAESQLSPSLGFPTLHKLLQADFCAPPMTAATPAVSYNPDTLLAKSSVLRAK